MRISARLGGLISNLRADYAIQHNLTPFISMQNHYSLAYREEEREMFPTLKVFVGLHLLVSCNVSDYDQLSYSVSDLFRGPLWDVASSLVP